ncbi:MAG: NADH-quinone oxidoreductase subunit J [Caldilineae bacterium]|nr:MAG: NADH-quinone oxidoreductase subunit J [Caldilineae bacterium]
MTLLLFTVLALIALVGAVGVVMSRNAVYSALFLLVNFATIAVMYFMLSAQFLGVVQVIIYAGAIVVLFLFVIMLIGGQIGPVTVGGRRYARLLALVLGAAFLLLVVLGLGAALPPGEAPLGAPQAGSVQAVGQELYTTYLIPFELASILLLVGMLGGVVLARRYRELGKD